VVALPVLMVVLKLAVLMIGVELTEDRPGCAHNGMGWKVGLASAGVFPALAFAAVLAVRE
jgi:hypothetical protein